MKLGLLALSSVATCALIVACSGGDPESTPAGTDGVAPVTTAPQPDRSTEPMVGSDTVPGEEDAGLITEGGGNPEEPSDAGLVSDAGPDGGTCGPGTGNGPAIASACSSSKTFNGGGTITPGTYDLAGFTLTGSLAFCSSYTVRSYAGRLDVTADGQGGFILGERAVQVGGFSPVPNKSFSAKQGSGVLQVVQTCGLGIKSVAFGYTASVTDGKPTIVYTHDSGSAIVRYRWVMR